MEDAVVEMKYDAKKAPLGIYTPVKKKRNAWFRGSCAPGIGSVALWRSDIVSRATYLEFEP